MAQVEITQGALMLEAGADVPKLGLYLQVAHSQQSQPRFKPTQPPRASRKKKKPGELSRVSEKP